MHATPFPPPPSPPVPATAAPAPPPAPPAPTTSGLPRLTGKTAAIIAVTSILIFPPGWLALIAWAAYDRWGRTPTAAPRTFMPPPATTPHDPYTSRPVWEHPLDRLLAMTPDEFEQEVGRMLRVAGFTHVTVRGGSGDLGCDVAGVSPLGRRTVVQCKRYAPDSVIGVQDLQVLLGSVSHFSADLGMLVTTAGGFTGPAVKFARDNGLVLVDGHGVVDGLTDEAVNLRL